MHSGSQLRDPRPKREEEERALRALAAAPPLPPAHRLPIAAAPWKWRRRRPPNESRGPRTASTWVPEALE
eukprot:15432503-Alexandrium_andersonii.AAC.1